MSAGSPGAGMKPSVGWDSLRLENQIQLEDEKEDEAELGRKLDRKVLESSCRAAGSLEKRFSRPCLGARPAEVGKDRGKGVQATEQ